jgi:hypothetical protein
LFYTNSETDRQTDGRPAGYDESLLVAFSNFVNATLNQIADVAEEKITSQDNCTKHTCIVWKM